MRLFFVEPKDTQEGRVTLTGPDVHHIRRVLRLKPGDHIVVSDGQGRLSRVRLERLTEESAEGVVLEAAEALSPKGPSITLAQALPKARKFDFIIQKAVELGVERIVPLATRRAVVRLEGSRAAERLERWRRIAREAAKQCRRPSVAEVAPLVDMETFLSSLGPPEAGQGRLLLWEDAVEPLGETLERLGRPASLICLVGPEGGFEEAEAARAVEMGFAATSLGPRVLRTETAPVALLAILQYALGGL